MQYKLFKGLFEESFLKAVEYAGREGYVATLPQVLDFRVKEPCGKPDWDGLWDNYTDTMSAEYVGYSRGGVPLLIVAHGIGPLSTQRGIRSVYAAGAADTGGRITQEEFLALESGVYGPVDLVPLKDLWQEGFFFSPGCYTREMILDNPLFRARLGPQAEMYLKVQESIARALLTCDTRVELIRDKVEGRPDIVMKMCCPPATYANEVEFQANVTQPMAHNLFIGALVPETSPLGKTITTAVGCVSTLCYNKYLAVSNYDETKRTTRFERIEAQG